MAPPDYHSSSTYEYDVFLSFRGSDTRKNFTSHLYSALYNKGVHTFQDNKQIDTGEVIGDALFTAIKHSKISIPVISKRYASSKWCLKELAEIFQCYKTNNQIVLPVFFNVDPSDVRHQTGSFKKDFSKHERDSQVQPEMVQKWREALKEVGLLKGWTHNEVENGDESELVRSIVERVLSELNKTPLHVAKHPIGLETRVEKLLSLLSPESMDVRFVGICGMGGIGKTTIAKAVYNKIHKKFDGYSFLAETRKRDLENKLVELQNQFLDDILKEQNPINHVDGGKELIKERFQTKNVLLILDDVDHRRQLEALAGALNWFGPGSRIIITTRDMNVLNQVDNIEIYEAEVLDGNQSLLLFSRYVFHHDQPPEKFMDLSKAVVSYAGGLPLTLEVLGSFLCGVKSVREWESALQKLKEAPPGEVQEKLKISFDALDDTQKAMFLDTACLFVGKEKEHVTDVWKACGFCAEIDLNVLIRKFLVKIIKLKGIDALWMHDQLQDMGKKIVREENPTEPGKRSRLWNPEEIMEVLEEHKGTQKIEVIQLYSYQLEKEVPIRFEDFATMTNLRILLIDGIEIKGNIDRLPSKLKWLQLDLNEVNPPSNFYQEKLVGLNLTGSKIEVAWDDRHHNKQFENLEVLNLRESRCLSKSPNFSRFPQLKKLILAHCWELVDIHESIGQLNRLVHLDLDNCLSLIGLPRSIGTLYSLKYLFLDGSKLEELPDSIGDLKALEKLGLSGTRIHVLPNSIGRLSKLEMLSLYKCVSLTEIPDSIGGMKSLVEFNLEFTRINEIPNAIGRLSNLETLSLSGCDSLTKIPDSIGGMKSLVELNLDSTLIEEIPNDVGLLEKLEKLCVNCCEYLKYIPKLPTSLIFFDASRCDSLERTPDLSNMKNLQTLQLNSCDKLAEIQGLAGAESLEELDISHCYTLTPSKTRMDICDNQSFPFCEPKEPYVVGDTNGRSLFLAFQAEKMVQIQGIPHATAHIHRYDGRDCMPIYNITAHIHRNGKRITCKSSFHINEYQMIGDKNINFQQRFQGGLNWIVIPLKEEDKIEIDSIECAQGCRLETKWHISLVEDEVREGR